MSPLLRSLIVLFEDVSTRSFLIQSMHYPNTPIMYQEAEGEKEEEKEAEGDAMDIDAAPTAHSEDAAHAEWARQRNALVELRTLSDDELAQRDPHTLKAVRLTLTYP